MKGANVKPSDIKFDAAREGGFRRGYGHGVQAVLQVLHGHLDQKALTMLQSWAKSDLQHWIEPNPAGLVDPPAAPKLGE